MSASIHFDYAVLPNGRAPVIPVEFWGSGRWHKLWVYVDSGASFTVLHTFEARRLGINLKNCRKIYLVVAGGRKIPVFMKKVPFRVGRTRTTVEIGFCSVLGGAFNLLGRKDVFRKFKICFNEKKEAVSFQPA
jgi:hypothetical protein